MINGNKDSSSISYSLDNKNIFTDNNLYKNFSNVFYFGGSTFSNFSADCLTDEKVFKITLAKYFNRKDDASLKDSVQIVNNKVPQTFINASDEITSLFGEMTSTKNETDNLGYHLYRTWECDKNKVELSLWYWNTNNSMFYDFSLIIDVSFTDKGLEKLNKLWKYKN